MIRRRVPAVVLVLCLAAAAFAVAYWVLGAFPEQRGLVGRVAIACIGLGLAVLAFTHLAGRRRS